MRARATLFVGSRLFTALALIPTPVAAQAAEPNSRLVVIRTVAGDEPPGLASLAESLEASAGRERPALLATQAAALISQRHSAEPAAASQDDFDALARESEQALEHVAFGRRQQAQRSVARILERAQNALEALNRESRSARRVLNSCLYLVRALDDAHDDARALDQAVECARLVPDMTPSAAEHPPSVRTLFDQAVDRIENGPHGALRVTSEPSGCSVYLNGRRLGQTPFTRDDLPTGEYRVQVECAEGRPGRVHRLVLPAEPRELAIDERFDRTLRTTANDVRLEYDNAADQGRYRVNDVLAIARIVDATEVWLVTAEREGVARVDRIDVGGPRVLASARVSFTSAGAAREPLASITMALVEGRSVDASGETEQPMEPFHIRPRSARAPSASGAAHDATGTGGLDAEVPDDGDGGRGAAPPSNGPPAGVGFALGGAGIVALGVAWGLQGEWFRLDDRVSVAVPTNIDFQDRVDRRDAIELPVALVGLGGALLTTGALPFLLGDDGPAWWHFVFGGVGVVVLGAGIGLWAIDGTFSDDAETQRHNTVPVGPLLVETAVPLLAVPIVALLTKLTGDSRTARISAWPVATADSAELVVAGRF